MTALTGQVVAIESALAHYQLWRVEPAQGFFELTALNGPLKGSTVRLSPRGLMDWTDMAFAVDAGLPVPAEDQEARSLDYAFGPTTIADPAAYEHRRLSWWRRLLRSLRLRTPQ